MITFEEYVLNWWSDFLEDITEKTAKRIMDDAFIGEEESVDDYVGTAKDSEAKSCREWLRQQNDVDTIYSTFFGYNKQLDDSKISTEDFLEQVFLENVMWPMGPAEVMPSFAEEFVQDMAYHAAEYGDPLCFFNDLRHGCQSGMIGMLIYNSDCKDIYIKHIDDMEEYKTQLEDDMDECIRNRTGAPHYTFMCWLCYEELGFSIARNLFPDTF
jgi:hypothetical protein